FGIWKGMRRGRAPADSVSSTRESMRVTGRAKHSSAHPALNWLSATVQDRKLALGTGPTVPFARSRGAPAASPCREFPPAVLHYPPSPCGRNPTMARPRPVTILAVLSLFLAFWYLLVGALLSTGKIPIGEMMKQVPQFADMQETFERAAVVFALLFGCAYLFTGIGLLRTMNWARASARVLGVLGLLSALIQMIQAFVARDP